MKTNTKSSITLPPEELRLVVSLQARLKAKSKVEVVRRGLRLLQETTDRESMREAYRRAFSEFDPHKVARYTEKKIQSLVADPGIVRNRMKIEAAVKNARAFLAIQEEFGSFDAYCWPFVGGKPLLNRRTLSREIPATSPESDAFSKDLKRRGFGFVGSTIIYAHMQAVGMVNDHLVGCFRYREVGRATSPRAT